MKVAITGGTGYLGSFLLQELLRDGRFEVTSISRRPHPVLQDSSINELLFEIGDLESLKSRLLKVSPDAIVHVGAMASAGACETHPEEAKLANVSWTESLVEVAQELGCYFVYISTDLVFDGSRAPAGGFSEEDRPKPLSVYAKTKYQAEQVVIESGLSASVVRTSLMYGPRFGPRAGPLGWMKESFEARQSVTLFTDEWRTPIYVKDSALTIIQLLERRLEGIFHLAGPQRVSRVEFGEFFANHFGYDSSLIVKAKREEFAASPRRPEDVSLCIAKITKELGVDLASIESVFASFEE